MHFLSSLRRDPSACLARSLLAGSLLAGSFGLGACGDDDTRPPAPPPRDMDITFDAGDGGMLDGDVGDAGGGDGGTVADGGTGACRVEGDILTLATDVVDRSVRAPDVAVSGSTFAIVWTDARSGVADAFVYAWPAAAASGTEVRLTDDFSPTRDVRIAGRTDGFAVGWIDNSLGSFELLARSLSAEGAIDDPIQRITNNMQREDSPSLAQLADGSAMVAWLESDGLGSPATSRAVPLDVVARAVGTPAMPVVPPSLPADPRLGRLGDGAALGWTEAGTVYVQPLTPTGAARGAATTINTEGNASTSPSLALGDTGGGVAFGVLVAGARQEIRMRTVDASGVPDGPEAILTPPPSRGTDPKIATFATGYAVAYRTNEGSGSIRLAFATALGELSSTLEVATTASSLGSGPGLAVAPDGRMVLAWLETDTVTATVRAAKVVCE